MAGLLAGSRFAVLAGPLLVLDLLIVNGPLNPLVPRSFLALGPEVQALVDQARALPGEGRFFSYGVQLGEGRNWKLAEQGRRLVALHRLLRQSLTQPTPVIDGLDGALDLGRTGWEPAASTLAGSDNRPARFPRSYAAMRLEGIEFVLSFVALPEELCRPSGAARVAGVESPLLRLCVLKGALPRAYWVPRCTKAPDATAARAAALEPSFDPTAEVVLDAGPPCGPGVADESTPATLRYRRKGPHRVEVRAETPPGWIVVLESYHPSWTARSGERTLPLHRANGRFWAVETPGGTRRFEFHFEPDWPGWSLTAAGLGLALALGLTFVGRSPSAPTLG